MTEDRGVPVQVRIAPPKMRFKVRSDNIYLPVLKIGTTLRFFTQNSEYNIEKINEPNIFRLTGGKYFPPNSKVEISGTTFGGSIIRSQQLAHGIVEIVYDGKVVSTSWCDKVEYIIE